MGRYFGTDGIRGKVGRFPLTADFFYKLAISAGLVLSRNEKITRIFIGQDTRNSSDMIRFSLSAGFSAIGLDLIDLGMITTPAVATIVQGHKNSVGVMISASHNPYMDNGIKFFNCQGFKLSDAIENEIEKMVDNQEFFQSLHEILEKEESLRFGIEQPPRSFLNKYLSRMKKVFHKILKKKGLIEKSKLPTLFLDCANGATSIMVPRFFKSLGFEIEVMENVPDGFNINENCGATHPQTLGEKVASFPGYALGFCFDGDGDRLIAIDEKGEVVDGDQVMVVIAAHLHKMGLLKNPVVAVTVMSNLGLHQSLKKRGIQIETTPVGDRYVLEAMLEKSISMGGEQSGHLIFLDFSTTGDGLLSALILLAVILNEGTPLYHLKTEMALFPQILKNLRVLPEKKNLWKENLAITSRILDAEKKLGENGRILVRTSGTEPLIRVMAEGPKKESLNELVDGILGIMEKELCH